MKLSKLLELVGISQDEIEHLNVDEDCEVVVITDRQLLPNASYDFEVVAPLGGDVEFHVRGRHAGR